MIIHQEETDQTSQPYESFLDNIYLENNIVVRSADLSSTKVDLTDPVVAKLKENIKSVEEAMYN